MLTPSGGNIPYEVAELTIACREAGIEANHAVRRVWHIVNDHFKHAKATPREFAHEMRKQADYHKWNGISGHAEMAHHVAHAIYSSKNTEN